MDTYNDIDIDTDHEPVVIRRAVRRDVDTLLILIDALADYERLPRPDEAARTRLIADGWERDPPRFEVYLAYLQGHVAGYAIALETYSSFMARPTLYLEDLFVLPDARRHGVATSFFRFLIQEADRRGCGRMEWICLNWNQPAISFYERHGATHLDEWRTYRLTDTQIHALANGPDGESAEPRPFNAPPKGIQ